MPIIEEKKTIYKCSDGEIHETRLNAERHEMKLQLKKFWARVGYVDADGNSGIDPIINVMHHEYVALRNLMHGKDWEKHYKGKIERD